jgi:hypothetical protein
VQFGTFSSDPVVISEFLANDWTLLWNQDNNIDWNETISQYSWCFEDKPPFTTTMITIEDWCIAISKLKSFAGKGVDNWSAVEIQCLSEDFILSFLAIANSLTSQG